MADQAQEHKALPPKLALEKASAQRDEHTESSIKASTIKTLPALIEVEGNQVFLNLIRPFKQKYIQKLFCELPLQCPTNYDGLEAYEKELKLRKSQHWMKLGKQQDKDPRQQHLQYFRQSGFYNPKGGEDFFKMIFPFTQDYSKEYKSKGINTYSNLYIKMAQEGLLSLYLDEEKIGRKSQLFKDTDKKWKDHVAQIKQKMKEKNKRYEQFDFEEQQEEMMAAVYYVKSGIKPDFVYRLDDAFSIDESLLELSNDQDCNPIKLLSHDSKEAIEKYSKYEKDNLFVGEITSSPFDLGEKILTMDHYLYHAQRVYEKCRVFGVIIVNGTETTYSIKATLDLIPQNSRIGIAYKENRLIVLKIPVSTKIITSQIKDWQQRELEKLRIKMKKELPLDECLLKYFQIGEIVNRNSETDLNEGRYYLYEYAKSSKDPYLIEFCSYLKFPTFISYSTKDLEEKKIRLKENKPFIKNRQDALGQVFMKRDYKDIHKQSKPKTQKQIEKMDADVDDVWGQFSSGPPLVNPMSMPIQPGQNNMPMIGAPPVAKKIEKKEEEKKLK